MLRISEYTFIVEATKTHILKTYSGERIPIVKGEIYKVRMINSYYSAWYDFTGDKYEFTRYKPREYDEDKQLINKWFLVKWLWFRPFKKLDKDAVTILFRG